MPAKKPSKSSPKTYTHPELRDRLKAEITAGDKGGKPGQWSARKAQLLAAEYKKAGGGYTGQASEGQAHLKQWTAEEWTTHDGQPAQQGEETARYLPKKAWEELTPEEAAETDAVKRKGSRTGKQNVPNTPAAKQARRRATQKKPATRKKKASE